MNKYGVRIYLVDSEKILIKQTVKKPASPRYVVDTLQDGTHREAHIPWNETESIADAVRSALKGKLAEKEERI
ncbi:hypothetical protein ES703_39683 [subsurface metagenome]